MMQQEMQRKLALVLALLAGVLILTAVLAAISGAGGGTLEATGRDTVAWGTSPGGSTGGPYRPSSGRPPTVATAVSSGQSHPGSGTGRPHLEIGPSVEVAGRSVEQATRQPQVLQINTVPLAPEPRAVALPDVDSIQSATNAGPVTQPVAEGSVETAAMPDAAAVSPPATPPVGGELPPPAQTQLAQSGPPPAEEPRVALPAMDGPYSPRSEPEPVAWPADARQEERYVEVDPAPSIEPEPAPPVTINVNAFHEELRPYGQWVEVAPYGRCWTPYGLAVGWRPYTIGRWTHTEYGWAWVSDEVWGDVTYHYGRWMETSPHGWVWVPGSVWSPAWVSWRHGDGYIGWAPLPPSIVVHGHLEAAWIDREVPPSRYCFVEERRMVEHHVHRHLVPPQRNVAIISKTTNITNIQVVNKTAVNRSLTVEHVERVTGGKVVRAGVREVASLSETRHARQNGEVAVYRPQRPPADRSRTVSTQGENRFRNGRPVSATSLQEPSRADVQRERDARVAAAKSADGRRQAVDQPAGARSATQHIEPGKLTESTHRQPERPQLTEPTRPVLDRRQPIATQDRMPGTQLPGGTAARSDAPKLLSPEQPKSQSPVLERPDQVKRQPANGPIVESKPEASRQSEARPAKHLGAAQPSSLSTAAPRPAAGTVVPTEPAMKQRELEAARAEQARREAAEHAKVAESKRQEAERSRIERARRDEAERAKMAEAERTRMEQAKRDDAARAKMAEAKRQEAERAKVEQAQREENERLRAMEARRQEAERAHAEQAKQAEAERTKAMEAQRQMEAQRTRAEQARREEADRARVAEAKRQEAERAKAEQAKREEAERAKATEAKRQEAERAKAEQARPEAADRARSEARRREDTERVRAEQARREEAERSKAAETKRQQEAQHAQAEKARRDEAERAKAGQSRRQENDRSNAEASKRQEAKRPDAPEPKRPEPNRAKSADTQQQEPSGKAGSRGAKK